MHSGLFFLWTIGEWTNVLSYMSDSEITLLKKTIEPCPKHNRKCNGFNGYNGNWFGFNGHYNGVYWYVMDYIGGMLNPIGKMPKTQYKRNFVLVLLEKANGS